VDSRIGRLAHALADAICDHPRNTNSEIGWQADFSDNLLLDYLSSLQIVGGVTAVRTCSR
jgi:hypothetical protein